MLDCLVSTHPFEKIGNFLLKLLGVETLKSYLSGIYTSGKREDSFAIADSGNLKKGKILLRLCLQYKLQKVTKMGFRNSVNVG